MIRLLTPRLITELLTNFKLSVVCTRNYLGHSTRLFKQHFVLYISHLLNTALDKVVSVLLCTSRYLNDFIVVQPTLVWVFHYRH